MNRLENIQIEDNNVMSSGNIQSLFTNITVEGIKFIVKEILNGEVDTLNSTDLTGHNVQNRSLSWL